MIGEAVFMVKCDGKQGGEPCRASEIVRLPSALLEPRAVLRLAVEACPQWRLGDWPLAFCPSCAAAMPTTLDAAERREILMETTEGIGGA